MDKHDRPYKCPADGCEKLPGFTYSGGLHRHGREVHNKPGGQQLNCSHDTCKRHTGKGFSRQAGLNEHLRRVHTDTGAQDGEITEEEEDAKTGQKRKRSTAFRGVSTGDLHEEMKRLKAENEELRRQSQIHNAQVGEMMRQIQYVGLHNPSFEASILNQNTSCKHKSQVQTLLYRKRLHSTCIMLIGVRRSLL
jgi:hypothetical protein